MSTNKRKGAMNIGASTPIPSSAPNPAGRGGAPPAKGVLSRIFSRVFGEPPEPAKPTADQELKLAALDDSQRDESRRVNFIRTANRSAARLVKVTGTSTSAERAVSADNSILEASMGKVQDLAKQLVKTFSRFTKGSAASNRQAVQLMRDICIAYACASIYASGIFGSYLSSLDAKEEAEDIEVQGSIDAGKALVENIEIVLPEALRNAKVPQNEVQVVVANWTAIFDTDQLIKLVGETLADVGIDGFARSDLGVIIATAVTTLDNLGTEDAFLAVMLQLHRNLFRIQDVASVAAADIGVDVSDDVVADVLTSSLRASTLVKKDIEAKMEQATTAFRRKGTFTSAEESAYKKEMAALQQELTAVNAQASRVCAPLGIVRLTKEDSFRPSTNAGIKLEENRLKTGFAAQGASAKASTRALNTRLRAARTRLLDKYIEVFRASTVTSLQYQEWLDTPEADGGPSAFDKRFIDYVRDQLSVTNKDDVIARMVISSISFDLSRQAKTV